MRREPELGLGAGQRGYKDTCLKFFRPVAVLTLCLLYCNKHYYTLNSASATFIGRREEHFLNILWLKPGWFDPKIFQTIIFVKLEIESSWTKGEKTKSHPTVFTCFRQKCLLNLSSNHHCTSFVILLAAFP